MLRKYTLYLAGVLGLILGSVGCGGHRHTGYLSVTWNVVDSRSGVQGSCEWAGISEVELGLRDVYTGDIEYIPFDCTAYQGTSYPLPESNYGVALDAYSITNQLITRYEFQGEIPVYSGRTTPLSAILYYP